MVTITFPDRETQKRALGRFLGRVLRSGEYIVPEAALEILAIAKLPFLMRGHDGHEQTPATPGAAHTEDVADGV